jgi:hypothetical protein
MMNMDDGTPGTSIKLALCYLLLLVTWNSNRATAVASSQQHVAVIVAGCAH